MKKIVKKKQGKSRLLIVGLALVVLIFLALIVYFLRGKTKVNKPLAKVEKSDYLTCTSSDNEYPFFTYDNSYSKSLKINATFVNEKLSNISLIYVLYYHDQKSITDSENLNHAAISISYASNGLKFDAFNTQFSKFSEGLQFSISANINDKSSTSLKYFMLSNIATQDKKEVQLALEKQNFSCKNNI